MDQVGYWTNLFGYLMFFKFAEEQPIFLPYKSLHLNPVLSSVAGEQDSHRFDGKGEAVQQRALE